MANAKPSGPTNFPTKYHVLLWFSYVLTNNRQKRGVSGSIKSRASVPSCPNTISFCPLYLSRPSLSASYRVVPRGQLFLSLFFLFFLFFFQRQSRRTRMKTGSFPSAVNDDDAFLRRCNPPLVPLLDRNGNPPRVSKHMGKRSRERGRVIYTPDPVSRNCASTRSIVWESET